MAWDTQLKAFPSRLLHEDRGSDGFTVECARQVSGYETIDDLDLAGMRRAQHVLEHDRLDDQIREAATEQLLHADAGNEFGLGFFLGSSV